jgi:hypothetical protein
MSTTQRGGRRPGVNHLATYALAGILVGLGLGLWTNVSGVVLSFYGLVLGTVIAMIMRSRDRG